MNSATVLSRTVSPRLMGLLAAPALAWTMAGCAPKETPATSTTSTLPDTGPTSTSPAETATRSSTGPAVKPPKGFGNAQGKILWNEKPAAGVKVTLCESISFVSGCAGKTYNSRTDKDGNYTIDKVPPGDYSLAVQVFDTDTFIYPTSGIMSAAKFGIEADKTLDIRATNIYKTDLQVVSPRAGETVKTGLPKLTWKAYGGATQYEISLTGVNGGGASQSMKTASNSVAPETPLLNGSYQWDVVAKNANGTKIASTSSSTPFKVTGQAGSNSVYLVSPHPDAAVAGTGLKFIWKAHPLANGYQIYLADAKSSPILSFEKLDGGKPEYSLNQTLSTGTYYWSITATKDGEKLAQSDLKSFRVK